MKHYALLIASISLLFSSCGSGGTTAVDKDGNIVASSYTKKVDLPVNPCEYITRKMVIAHFDVTEEDLELDENFSKINNSSAVCGYKWRKSNHEELEEIQRNVMLDYAMQGVTKREGSEGKIKISDLTKLESPNSIVQIGMFEQYDKMQTAVDRFIQLHRVPTKEDMAVLNKEIDKEFKKKGLDEKSKNMGKGLSGGIASSMKFTEITGVGDQAFFDHLNKSLDVRFGTLTFKVIIDSELSFDENVEIAIKIAKEVWDKL